MATDRLQQLDHDAQLGLIADALTGELWEERLSAIELARGLLNDLPKEKTVEHLVDVLDHLSQDTKWEVRRAVVPALVDAARPAARAVIDRLAGDSNRWVRHAANRAKRKLAHTHDARARAAVETIKDLDGSAADKIRQAAVLLGEEYYEELAGDTAHELNTYRTAMEVLLHELEARLAGGNGASPDVSDVVDKIRDRSRYLKALVTGLVEYSKDAESDIQVHEVGPILTQALDLAREKAGAILGDQRVEEVLEIVDGIEVEGCGARLAQALANVLSNALESLAGGGPDARVEISAEPSGRDEVIITIIDTGSGMNDAQVESAKKRFRSFKKEQGGIGLGLPLALKIIEREHGGRLEIASTIGVGTRVTIHLPKHREREGA